MDPTTPSRTALFTAVQRGAHARSSSEPILVDPWGERLVPEATRAAVARHASTVLGVAAATAAQVDDWLRRQPAFGNVVMRSRYTEDHLREAVARGVHQYVIVGAGFDTSWLRLPPGSHALRVFEVDHPATQALKRRRIAECGLECGHVAHLPADLARESLAAVLRAGGFDAQAPAFFSWLGVTMYLTREANMAALAGIRACAAAGGELVFTYIDQAAWSAKTDSGHFGRMREQLAALGEPFLCGFDPATLGDELARIGFELAEDLADRELVQRYDPRGVHGFATGGASRIARAVVR
jgi:methyltransferase (TIGR00027 family)